MNREFYDTHTYCGKYIEVRRTSTMSNRSSYVRSKRKSQTNESVSRNNDKLAIRKMRNVVNLNFNENDWFVTLTFNDNSIPATLEDAQKLFKKYSTILRKLYKRQGLELKYIYTIEVNRSSESPRVHCHLLINANENIAKNDITGLWPYGFTKIKSVSCKSGTLDGLAEYMIKESQITFREKEYPWRRRYFQSRNLQQPQTSRSIIPEGAFCLIPKDNDKYFFDEKSFSAYEDIVGNQSISFRMKKRNVTIPT